MARARCRLRIMPETLRSSITIMSAERTRPVLARCRKSRRASRTLRWARATFAVALARFADPFRQRARRRWYRARLRALRARCRGLAIFSPSESRRSPSRPGRRRPRARSAPAVQGHAVSMVKVTYQRPSGSRDTITIVGSSAATSTSGQDQVNRSGAAVLASRSCAAAHREGAAGVVRGLPAAAGLEPRVAGAPGEERGECLVLVAERLLQRDARTPRSGRPGPGPFS